MAMAAIRRGPSSSTRRPPSPNRRCCATSARRVLAQSRVGPGHPGRRDRLPAGRSGRGLMALRRRAPARRLSPTPGLTRAVAVLRVGQPAPAMWPPSRGAKRPHRRRRRGPRRRNPATFGCLRSSQTQPSIAPVSLRYRPSRSDWEAKLVTPVVSTACDYLGATPVSRARRGEAHRCRAIST